MKTIVWLVIGTLLTAPITWAQESNPYTGTWSTVMVGKKGDNRKGVIILDDKGGTWDIDWSTKNPCAVITGGTQ